MPPSETLTTLPPAIWEPIFEHTSAEDVLSQSIAYCSMFAKADLFPLAHLRYFVGRVPTSLLRKIIIAGDDIPLSIPPRSLIDGAYHPTSPLSEEEDARLRKLAFCIGQLRINPQDLGEMARRRVILRLAKAPERFVALVLRNKWIPPDFASGPHSLLAATAAAGNLPMVRFLVRFGATVNRACPRYGTTALHCGIEHAGVVKYLVRKGASLISQDRCGNTPLEIAAECHETNTALIRHLTGVLRCRQQLSGMDQRLSANPALLWDAPDCIQSNLPLVAYVLCHATTPTVKSYMRSNREINDFPRALLAWVRHAIAQWKAIRQLRKGHFPQAANVFGNKLIVDRIMGFSCGKTEDTDLCMLQLLRAKANAPF